MVMCPGKSCSPCEMAKEKVLQLVKDCQPATFGFGGEDVFNEKIRKAGKLEATKFSTSFNPYDFDIVDTVAQALLPGIVGPAFQDKNISTEHWGVLLEVTAHAAWSHCNRAVDRCLIVLHHPKKWAMDFPTV